MRTILRQLVARYCPTDIAVFTKLQRPPYGGANQFMLALCGEFKRRGLRVGSNAIPSTARACLFIAQLFDFKQLQKQRQRHPGCRMVHRVDGPVGIYRGDDDGTDQYIWKINEEIADTTILQSRYSLEKNRALGYEFKNPVVITNAADPHIFKPANDKTTPNGRKVRLISTSWSTHPNKGAATYRWIEENLDWSRFEYTFVGRAPVAFEKIRTVPAVASEQLADLLRQHDIYLTASLHESCSNALIEALACGLPAIYAASGGNPEIVKEAGFGYTEREEIPLLLDRLVEEYEVRKSRISIPTLAQVADRYLEVMGDFAEYRTDRRSPLPGT